MTLDDLRTALSIALVVGIVGHATVASAAVPAPAPRPDATAEMVVPDGQTEETASENPLPEPGDLPVGTDLPSALAELTTAVDEGAAGLAEAPVDPPSLFVAAAYSRSVTSEPLVDESRREVFERIHANPGVSRSRLAEETELSPSSVRYHVEVLSSVGMVASHTVLGRVRLAEAEVSRAQVDLQAALDDEGTAPVLAAVARLGTPSQATIADAVDRAPSTVSYHVDRLVAAGLLERERVGRRATVELTDRAESVPIAVALSGVDSSEDD